MLRAVEEFRSRNRRRAERSGGDRALALPRAQPPRSLAAESTSPTDAFGFAGERCTHIVANVMARIRSGA
jgi:hypothetical protein